MMKLLSAIKDFFVKFHSLEIDTSKIDLSKINPASLLKKNKNTSTDSDGVDTGVWMDDPHAEDIVYDFPEEQKIEKKRAEKVEKILRPKQPVRLPKHLALDMRVGEIGRYFSGDIFQKAMLSMDKATLLIIGSAWLAALVVSGFAFMSIKDLGQLKIKTETARALDPVLPKIVRLPLGKEQYEPLLQRLKKQFPMVQLEITGKPNLKIQNNNPDAFMDWLNAISYVDGMVSTVRWTMTSFCVGVECTGDALMQAELTAEAINITQPETVAP
jgi:hypothetical protein